ncbi:MAG: hypothetical protein GXO47_02035 [Chlorobi bacterium]|nr:hypothetical protein [Chlorobiota bacterium]
MKKILGLLFKLAALAGIGWFLFFYVKQEQRDIPERGDENYDVTSAGDNEDLDKQAKSVLGLGEYNVEYIDSTDNGEGTNLKINGRAYSYSNAFYETDGDDGIEITLPGSAYTVIARVGVLKPGVYDLSESENNLKVFDGNNFNEFNEGTITISSISEGLVAGSFKAGGIEGRFADARPVSALKTKPEELVYMQSVLIKPDGTVEKKDGITEVNYDERNFHITFKGAEGNSSFSTGIRSMNTTPVSVLIKVDDDDIDFILVDFVNKQMTLQYKNGESLVLS